jgi:hypothetical protein
MTDAAFRAGMAQLAVTFPSADEESAVKGMRSQVYRRILDYMSDAEFAFAVDEALRYEKWFPTPASLISYADDYKPPAPALPAGRTAEQLEAERAAARGNLRSGVELVRAELQKRGLLAADAPEPVESMKGGSR